MEAAVRNIHEQFSYVPIVEGNRGAGIYKQYIVAGMGGSHLAAGILKRWKPGSNVYVHRTYDLPPYDESFLEESLLIACSYSGNTEETLSFAEEAVERGLSVAVITTGGRLLELAEEHDLPRIVMPAGIQPRAALGHMLIALATFVNEPGCVADLHRMAETFRASAYETLGREIAGAIGDAFPVMYASNNNVALAYNWKIKCNETAKIPAFYNLLPEANHNEMHGFDDAGRPFHFVMLVDPEDHERIQKRMFIMADMLETRGYQVTVLRLIGDTVLERLFSSLVIADWVTIAIAADRGVPPEAVPMIETFKQYMREPYEDRLEEGHWFL